MATAEFLRQPQESLDFGVLRPPYGRRRNVNVTEVLVLEFFKNKSVNVMLFKLG